MSSNIEIEAGRQISKQLLPSEDAIDGSIVQNAKLIISIVEGRKKMGVAAEVGHDALLSATAGMAALTQARDHTVTCHRQLTSVRDALGYGPRAFGCTINKLPPPEEPGSHLKVVETKVA
jgi:hypothetical protein